MRFVTVVFVGVVAGLSVSAVAEVQDVTVGGSLRIRGNWFSNGDLDFDNRNGNDALFFEQRTSVKINAELTDDINAVVEFDRYNIFGDGFRGLSVAGGNYALNGVDNGNGSPAGLYQAFVEVVDAWGTPISFRIGRQEIQLGSEFLVGNNDSSKRFRGLSFDGFTSKSHFGDFQIQSWFTELVTNNNPNRIESSGDIWFNGYYMSYGGFEGMTIDAYIMSYYQALTGPLLTAGYVKTANFYTAGVRFAGSRARFDWDAEGAYQIGDSGLPDVAGVSASDVSAFAMTATGGYTFDVKTQPRLFLNGVYLGGDKKHPAFNRMFSDHKYSEFLDDTGLSNIWMIGAGASAQVTEDVNLSAEAKYFQAVESFGAPHSDLGVEAALYATYRYSEDLEFRAGYAHFFAGDGVQSAQRVAASGFRAIGGLGRSDDIDYGFIETRVKF